MCGDSVGQLKVVIGNLCKHDVYSSEFKWEEIGRLGVPELELDEEVIEREMEVWTAM